MKIHVCFVPEEYDVSLYKEWSAVVIDVFRATTSMITAFANGCQFIIPATDIEAASAQKSLIYPQAVLAGERHGVRITGFDLGNSPFEFSKDNVSGKQVIMTTTNGTRALSTAAQSKQAYVASFVNVAAVSNQVSKRQSDTVIVCSGTDGRFSVEDVACAGRIIEILGDEGIQLNDKALAARAMYRGFGADWRQQVMMSSHARFLSEIGYSGDVEFCLRTDVFDIAPLYSNGMIRV